MFLQNFRVFQNSELCVGQNKSIIVVFFASKKNKEHRKQENSKHLFL